MVMSMAPKYLLTFAGRRLRFSSALYRPRVQRVVYFVHFPPSIRIPFDIGYQKYQSFTSRRSEQPPTEHSSVSLRYVQTTQYVVFFDGKRRDGRHTPPQISTFINLGE